MLEFRMFKFFTIFILTLIISMSFSQSKELIIVYPSDRTLDPGISLMQKVVKEVYKRLNIEIEFKRVHATRSLIMANSGKADAELIRTKMIEKKFKDLIRVNFPIDKIRFRALSLNPQISDVTINELMNKPLAFKRGFLVLEKIFKNNKLVNRITNSEQIYKMLLTKRVDFGIVLTRASHRPVMKDAYKKIRIINTNIPDVNLYHYVNRKHKRLVPKMLEVLKKMKEEKLFKSFLP